ncbi:MAG: GIY-YIG nuclease family protein [Candidatus Doudnabacteria bacterium]|nr:GIY-YIG nuclease family protein [Candidatus Doudnabacteria bacterium]
MEQYYIYILASMPKGVLYVGLTNDLIGRVWQHKQDLVMGFTKRYHVHKLVYYEIAEDHDSGLQREKILKKWRRNWKIELIEKNNPKWKDLYHEPNN